MLFYALIYFVLAPTPVSVGTQSTMRTTFIPSTPLGLRNAYQYQ